MNKNANSIEKLFKKYIAMSRYESIPQWEDDYDVPDDHDDDNADQTFSFGPPHSSTPYNQEMEMKTFQEEKSGLPETSYAETSFGGTKILKKGWPI